MRLVIARYRKQKGMTQAALAEKAGLTRSIIAQYETGASGVPFTEILTKIAHALNVEVGDLFAKEGDIQEAPAKGRPPKHAVEPLEEASSSV